jgi:cobalt-zinc-cadmium efflux system outer membrane protein
MRALPVLRSFAIAAALAGPLAVPAFAGQQPAAATPPPAQSSATTLSYQSAVQRALGNNPRITAARLRRGTGIASRDVAAERLNPELHAEFAKETPKEAYTFAVPLELGGKRARRIELADATILTGEAELNQVIAEVQAGVRRAYFTLVIAGNRAALLDELQMLAARARDAAQTRFDAGAVPRLEVVQAQLALADVQNQASAAGGAVKAARVSLNALLGLPLDAQTTVDTSLDAGPSLQVDTVLARARQSSAELLVFDRRIAEQRSRVNLSQALRTVDVTPEATLTRRAQPEFDTGWRAAMGVTLPIFTTHQAGVRVEEAALAQLSSERDAAVARISGDVTAAAAVAEAARLQYVRYRDEIVPQALEVERMADDAYRLGQTGIAAYLQALQATRDVRLRALQAAADLQSALADLEIAAGFPLTPQP